MLTTEDTAKIKNVLISMLLQKAEDQDEGNIITNAANTSITPSVGPLPIDFDILGFPSGESNIPKIRIRHMLAAGAAIIMAINNYKNMSRITNRKVAITIPESSLARFPSDTISKLTYMWSNIYGDERHKSIVGNNTSSISLAARTINVISSDERALRKHVRLVIDVNLTITKSIFRYTQPPNINTVTTNNYTTTNYIWTEPRPVMYHANYQTPDISLNIL